LSGNNYLLIYIYRIHYLSYRLENMSIEDLRNGVLYPKVVLIYFL